MLFFYEINKFQPNILPLKANSRNGNNYDSQFHVEVSNAVHENANETNKIPLQDLSIYSRSTIVYTLQFMQNKYIGQKVEILIFIRLRSSVIPGYCIIKLRMFEYRYKTCPITNANQIKRIQL